MAEWPESSSGIILGVMGDIEQHRPVLLVMAMFSRHDAALEWARQKASEAWGDVALESDVFSFSETSFYEPTMGPELKKTLLAFQRLVDPATLVAQKHRTNDWEDEYRDLRQWPEPRPLNLDPGYLTEAKLVLASTKDRDHRLYLDRGIYAEGTLYYHHGNWQVRPWTYPDYRREDYHQFFTRCRTYLRLRYREGA
jgi:hypothetical protein